MQASSILNAADMAQARSPENLRSWVSQKCRELAQSPEAKGFSQSGAPLAKKFHDEIYPLSVFVAHEYRGRGDVLIQPNLGNDNFDAKVTITGSSGAQTTFIEITCAKDGYDESLRMEVLLKEGGVFMTGPITKSGRRGAPDRIVKVTPEAASHNETLERYLQLIETTVEAKSQVRYGPQHILLVAVDDYLALIQDCDWPLLDQRAKSWTSRLPLDFGRVVFLGLAGRLFLSYVLPPPALAKKAL
jgi:hypothetical protein